jgi:hypothetical protein
MGGTKVRRGARGARKVKSWCSTCKYGPGTFCYQTCCSPGHRTRHKKCDELKPVCTQCRESGWRCDFLGMSGPSRACSSLQLTNSDTMHFEYFRLICAPEFSLFFQTGTWSNIVLQAACSDQSFRRIALAISALTRSRYMGSSQQHTADRYALCQYNMAIRELNLLDRSPQNVLRIVLACIMLITLEFLLENYNRVQIHLRSAISMLGTLERRFEPETTFYLQAITYVQVMMSCRWWATRRCSQFGLQY